MRLYPFLSAIKRVSKEVMEHLDPLNKVGKLTKEYSNLPDSYIRRSMEKYQWKTPRGYPMYLPRTVGLKRYQFGAYRPWSYEWSKYNRALGANNKRQLFEPIIWTIFNGDRVEILHGPDKGKQGVVCQVFEEANLVIVEGMNMKLEKLDRGGQPMYVRQEEALNVSRHVALVDPVDLKPCKVEWRFKEDGEKVRVSKRSGRIIPIPAKASETYDYKHPKVYVEAPKDTKDSEIVKITYEPKLKTFEMDIMDQMGIKEDRVKAPVYWY